MNYHRLFILLGMLLLFGPMAAFAQELRGGGVERFLEQHQELTGAELKRELMLRHYHFKLLGKPELAEYKTEELAVYRKLLRVRGPVAIYGLPGSTVEESFDVAPVPLLDDNPAATLADTIREQDRSICMIFTNEAHLEAYLKTTWTFADKYNPCTMLFKPGYPVSPPREGWGSMTGFLRDSTHVITSGHGVCRRNRSQRLHGPIKPTGQIAVFGLYDRGGPVDRQDLRIVPIKAVDDYSWIDYQDYSILELQEKVDLPSLEVEWAPQGQQHTPLYAIGHPLGLPMMYHWNGSVKQAGTDYFFCNLDLFGGNSGGPVFDRSSHRVLGILHKGKRDFGPEITLGERKCKRFDTYRMDATNAYEVIFRLACLQPS